MGGNPVLRHIVREPAQQRAARTRLLRCRISPRDPTGARLCSRLRDALSPEFVEASGSRTEEISYIVAQDKPAGSGEAPGYRVTCSGVVVRELPRCHCRQRARTAATAHRSHYLAATLIEGLFVHAGVVRWRGMAIVIPGRSLTGKITPVLELVRLGAVYYSDEFAVLDDTGRVYPYRRSFVLRDQQTGSSGALRLQWENVLADPLPIGRAAVAPTSREAPGGRAFCATRGPCCLSSKELFWRVRNPRGSCESLHELPPESSLCRECAPRLRKRLRGC